MSASGSVQAKPAVSVSSDRAIPVYRAVIRPSEDVGGYYAICDMAHGGCVVQGATLHEVQHNMLDAMEMYIEDHPEISDYSLDFVIKNT